MVSEGIINLNKPRDMTSHDCVQAIRKLTGIKRIGHTGTLDPQAEGVLPICIGGAARVMEYLELDLKKYRCGMALGLSTETQDIWGHVISDSRDSISNLTEDSIRGVFESFSGLIWQTPPKYSAIRYAGKRLYEYARAGEDVEVKKRNVFIKDVSILEIDLNSLTVTFEATCSKGTYIRTICSDAGEALGCGGAMNSLTRLASGVFTIEDSVTLDALSGLSEEGINEFVKPADYPLVHFGRAIIYDDIAAQRFFNGRPVLFSDAVVEAAPEYALMEPLFAVREEYRRAYNMYAGRRDENIFLGVAFLNEGSGEFIADKIFYKGTGK